MWCLKRYYDPSAICRDSWWGGKFVNFIYWFLLEFCLSMVKVYLTGYLFPYMSKLCFPSLLGNWRTLMAYFMALQLSLGVVGANIFSLYFFILDLDTATPLFPAWSVRGRGDEGGVGRDGVMVGARGRCRPGQNPAQVTPLCLLIW